MFLSHSLAYTFLSTSPAALHFLSLCCLFPWTNNLLPRHCLRLDPHTAFFFSVDYRLSHGSGTDDDFPTSNQNRNLRGSNIPETGKSVASLHIPKFSDMEAQIHQLEQEAYSSVLRAFKAQSDALTWEKEGLITELRKELRVSDDEHRELLTRVNADETIQRIREWRQNGCYQPARRSNSLPVYDFLPSPTVSASHKKQKTSQSVPSSGQSFPSLPLVKPMHYPSSGSAGGRHFINRSSSSVLASNAPAEVATFDPYIGKKVWTRWPEDNHFYEAVITDYNVAEGRHALVYDINTANETWEWVDLKEISPEDIQWEEEDPAITYRGRHSGQGRGVKKYHSRGGYTVAAGRGKGHPRVNTRREFLPPQNVIVNGNRVLDDIELPDTDSLVEEVERVIAESDPDPMELEGAKEMLKEHEQALVDAIAKLADASDGESDGEHPYLSGQLMDRG